MDKANEQTGPNWQAFGYYLGIGRLRIMGLAPVPPELKEKVEEVRAELLAKVKEANKTAG